MVVKLVVQEKDENEEVSVVRILGENNKEPFSTYVLLAEWLVLWTSPQWNCVQSLV